MRKTFLVLAALAAMSTISLAQNMRSDDLRTAQAKEMIVMTQTMVDEMQAMIDKLSATLTAHERQVKRMMEREMGGGDH